jgi:ubiquinone/menaquinone biosynthesis C-methylase UbiE
LKSRGQEGFASLPGFAARLYNSLTQTKAVERQHQEIARDLLSRIKDGRMLDIGTGPGKLLSEVRQLDPGIELFGLDVSEAMVQLARKRLTGFNVHIQRGGIRHTNYADDFFDIVTCTGSFYLWDNPEECLEEVFRILKQDRSAYLYETYCDFDESHVREAVRANLEGEGLIRRLVTPPFLMRQLRMTYRTDEFAGIIERTSFAGSYTIDQVPLGRLPAWLRIQLIKCA